MAKETMRAVVFKEVGRVVVEDRPMPRIEDSRDAIIKVTAAGLCGSDLHWFRGHQKLPGDFIPGHEIVGQIASVGSSVSKFKIGQPVVASFSSQCGDCFYCHKRQTSRCPEYYLFGNRSTERDIDGGQAEYVRIPYADSTLTLAPKSIPDKLLVLMGDIFPTGYFCASRFLKRMEPEEAKKTVVAVVGCGPVGICAIASALTWSDTVYAIDMVPDRLAEAEKIGAKPLLLSDNPAETIRAATEGRGADLALEVVGGQEPFNLCMDLIRPFGIISSVGVQTHDLTFKGPMLHGKNVTIEWGRCPVYGIFDESLECLVKVQDKVSFLCDKQMKLEDAVEAYEIFDNRKAHKIILVP
ncbi:related to alcohol dehydrogenase [Fusarium torulosum]|uniref:Related to alcohol dehydrogenase n=1 Tax=Fusarium torulosum TaxID=33205 RepID=A0AAE8SN49_9HYPO|nr:related to alcohol dehydrogenase [Fusarium torulosum]